jgi:glutaconate CoA-transferase, subunit B
VTAPYSTAELIAVLIARELRDGEVVVMGAVPALPLAACRLARATHAPHLWYLVGGSGAVNPEPAFLPASSCDPDLGPEAATLPLPEVVLLEGRGGAFDVFCAGGLQIDAHGNCNLIAVGNWATPALRGPGTVGLPFMPVTGRSIIYTTTHTPRSFVERVDFVSGPGHPASPEEDRTYRRSGPAVVITPLAVLDFDPASKRMRLASVHQETGEATVRAQTGFALPPGSARTTQPPSTEELKLLRHIDPHELLRP